MKARLHIDGTDVGFKSELPISINMAVADVREPDKRNSSFSKTISIPGTAEIIKKFEYIFQINAALSNFNPNIKTPAEYFVNEVRVFKGSLQLLRIKNKMLDNSLYPTFECNIVGDTGNLFLDIAGLYLTDLDFSEYDHTLTFASGLFSPVMGSGYCYPFIDYGLNAGSPCSTTWTFEHLKPALFEREYVRKIFSDAGYTWEAGGYFDSDYEKSIIIPDVNEGRLQMDQDTLDFNRFYAGRTSDDSPINTSGVYGSGRWNYSPPVIEPVPIDQDSVGSFYDPGSVFDTGTYIYSPAIDADYEIRGFFDYEFTINPPAGAVTHSGQYNIVFLIQSSIDGGMTWSNIASALSSGSVNNNLTVSGNVFANWIGNVSLPTIVQLKVGFVFIRWNFYDSILAEITTGTTSIDFTVGQDCYFFSQITSPDLQYGELVEMNLTIPREVTQLDFLTSIIKSENLYLELDKTNDHNYIIETREDFIQEDDPLDWTDKWDVSKDQDIIPMGELNFKKLTLSYKSDKDWYNDSYEKKWKEVYGTEKIDVQNDFVKNEKKIDVIFSATPIATSGSSDIVAPRFYKSSDGNSVSPLKCNIRRLIYGGLKPCASYTFSVNGSNSTETQYPFCGHIDDPDAPTVDLCFDNPNELYWNFPAQLYTDNGRYNERYSKFIQEITDPESKIVKQYFLLNEQDISQFSFRKIVFVHEAYYFVNNIMDYDPQVRKSILVELLKLKKGATFVSESFAPSARSIYTLGPSNPSQNYGGNSFGTNNINNGTNSFISGEGNYIG